MPTLFEETRIKSMTLKNRIVRSATFEGMSSDNGKPTDDLLTLYERLARGGTGLIITGMFYVSDDGKYRKEGALGIHTDDLIPLYRSITDRIHALGGAIATQIAHCGRQTTPAAIGTRPIAPSAVTDRSSFITPRAMTTDDIRRVIDDFAAAAGRAKQSGFDAVQIHGAHGYLVSSFLCPHTNRRTDRWGGSLENRMRFVTEVVGACRESVGDDYPLLIKISATDGMRRGLTLTESVEAAKMLDALGIDGIEVSCGIAEDSMTTLRGDLPIDALLDDLGMFRGRPLLRFFTRRFGKRLFATPFSEEYNLDAAIAIKEAVSVPVFAVGGVTRPERMEKIVQEGWADYISLSRPLIIQPHWPNKIQEGDTRPSPCIRCNHCLIYLPAAPLRCYHGRRIGEVKGADTKNMS
ncbi:MAG: NADH:flavin oxidoreductase [Deltaproteobacteria bacterium]|nr:NADH:flavin oxidoreductase [Candidatus Zymogenaceae bacterium]